MYDIEEDRYELSVLLGQGSFGSVWLAHHRQTQEKVALKLLRLPDNVQSEQAQLKERERFMREVQIALILDHPHILPALDNGYMLHNSHMLPYLVSPYMPDGSLAELIKKTPPWEHWTLTQTVDVILQAAEGLEYLHTRSPRIVHQDVKPGNFLLRQEPELSANPDRIVHLFLSDFGIARWQKTSFDMASQVIGTRGYLAPEQLNGKITPTSDQYSLAVMAHLLLTGSMPIREGNTLSPPSALNPKRVLSTEIDTVLFKALDLDSTKRYLSTLIFAKALQSAIAQTISPHDERTETGPNASTKSGSSGGQPPFIPVDEKLPPIHIEDSLKLDGNPVRDQRRPESSVPPSPPVPKPLPRQAFKQLNLSKELPALPNMLYWSKDGNYIVCTFYSKAPIVVGRNGNLETLRTSETARVACWAPRNHTLLVSEQSTPQQSTIRAWNVDTPKSEPLTLFTKNRAIESLDWSEQKQLAVWIESQIFVYTLPQLLSTVVQPLVPQTLTRPDMYCGSIGALRWSPDGSLLAAGTRSGAVLCWRADIAPTPALYRQEPASNQLVYSLAWSPDSTLLAVAFSNRRVVVLNVHTGQTVQEWKRLPIVPRMLSISPERRLVVASNTGELLFGNLDDPAPTATHAGYWLAAWSPTRPELATLDAQKETELIIWGE